jgi:hypothetical protein
LKPGGEAGWQVHKPDHDFQDLQDYQDFNCRIKTIFLASGRPVFAAM